MTTGTYDPQAEWQLVQKAGPPESNLTPLKDYLRPLVQSIASRYTEQSDGISTETLIETALDPLPAAVGHYLRHKESGKAPYKFSTYYTWWARKAIERKLTIGR